MEGASLRPPRTASSGSAIRRPRDRRFRVLPQEDAAGANLEYVQCVNRVGSLVGRYGFLVAIVIAALAADLELWLDRDSKDAPHTTLWFVLPAAAVVVLLLLAWRRLPFAVPATFWLAGAALSFIDGRLVVFPIGLFVAGMAAAFLLGNVRDLAQARIGLAIVAVSAAIIVYNKPDHGVGQLVFITLLFALCWLAGLAVRGRAQRAEAAEERATRAERERETATRLAVAEERARIARELHDVVAHALSVMVLQVGAVRHNLREDDEESRDALSHVEQAGRTALAEMRRLLGAMRGEGDDLELVPQPGLDRVESLLEEVRRAGLPVRLHVEGEPLPLPRAIDLSAYRIVQEGLTNVLKHAGAGRADVTVRYEPDDLRIEVRDDGKGAAADDGVGHGLVGIRERVKLYGGEMTAGEENGGGFVLRTRLPLTGYRP